MLLTEVLEIVLVLGSLVVELADLLDLVVVDGEGLVVDSETFLGRRGLIWLLEADEGVKLLLVLTRRVHLKALDLTVGGEELAKLFLCHGVREALHVEIAAFLGALVLDGLAESLGFAVSALECFFNIKLFVVWEGFAVDHGLTVEFLDGFLGATWAILAISLVLAVEADESVGALVVLHVLHGLNTAELAEQITHVVLCEVLREVLGIDVVVDLPEVTLVAWLVADNLDAVGVAFSLESLGCGGRVLEANEAIAA